MTKLTTGMVVRETPVLVGSRKRPLVVELHPQYLLMRLKGCPSTAVIRPLRDVFEAALMAEAKRKAAEQLPAPRLRRRR